MAKNYHTVVGNPIDELRDTILWKRLNQLNATKAEEVCQFVRYIDPVLNKVKNHFPLYTRHDSHHGYEVVERMVDVCMPELFNDDSSWNFSDDEIMTLIIVAYAHDVGMAIYENDHTKKLLLEKLGLPIDVADNNPILCNYLRTNHAERGLLFLQESEASQYVPEYIRGLIGQIMMGHNLTPSELIAKLPEEAAIGRKVSNPRALSIILCCADALEFSDTRVIDTAYNEALRREDEAAKKSLIEMRKHRAVGCGIAITREGFVIATGNFNEASTLHAIHTTLDQIEEWFRQYLIYNSRLKNPVIKIKNHSIIREAFTLNGFLYFPIAIKIDEYQIRELLTSQRLWGNDPVVPVRELVQNAVDACRYRNHILPPTAKYNPIVEIIVNMESREIMIKDNGCGMDVNDVVDYFLQIGKSKARDAQFKEDPRNAGFHTLSRFGVGFWSVFSIADVANVISKSFLNFAERNGINFNVTIRPVMRYLDITYSEEINEGTQICLKIKENIDISKILEGLEQAITAPEVPIIIRDRNGDVFHEFNNKLLPIEPIDVFKYRVENAKTQGIEWFSHAIDTDNLEFRIGFPYSKIENEYRCLAPSGAPMFSLMPGNGLYGLSTTSICGFSINFKYEPVPFAFSRIGCTRVNITSPKDFVFSFSRQTLDENEMFLQTQNEIRQCYAETLRKFYELLNIANSPEKIAMIIKDTRSNGGEAGDNRIPGAYNIYKTYYDKLVPVSLLNWEISGGDLRIQEKYMFLEDFWKLDKPVVYVCLWPSRYNQSEIFQCIVQIAAIKQETSGYVLLASDEASAIVDVANSVTVKNAAYLYQDWHSERNQYIEIDPSKGYSADNKLLFEISSRWSGHISSADFEKIRGTTPWMCFGRYRMFVDIEHPFIKRIIQINNEGRIWEVGTLLLLMSNSDESSYKELINKCKLSISY